MNLSPRSAGRRIQFKRTRSLTKFSSAGFTLLELAVVIFLMGLMLSLVMPYLGGFGRATLRSQARRLAGRATFMYDEAAGHKIVLRLTFNLDMNVYAVARLDPYALRPVFQPDDSPAGSPVMLPPTVHIRDVTVEGIGTAKKGSIATTFYPEGYVDGTIVHMEDNSGHVMTLIFSPLTGHVAITQGDVMPPGMYR
jgi:general secretion pathway protein H